MSSEKEEEVVITLEDERPTKRKKQSSLTSFFSGSISAVEKVNKTNNVQKTVKKWTIQIDTTEIIENYIPSIVWRRELAAHSAWR